MKRGGRRGKTRLEELQEAAHVRGYFVRTWSPGDGVTRYRFFDGKRDKEEGQSYFGPANGVYTALGLKEAYTFLGMR